MDIGTGKETLIHMLNHAIREGREECSATIDLLELDLLRGGGVFIKSGSPPSYIKRDSSIFRIRSHTAPIGLMRSIDTERISVEIKAGDYIFMFSDGIAEIAEDAPWLLLLLSEPPMNNLKEYAEYILTQAQKNGASGDDMTVTVIRVSGV
jgi:stage II sporulation protein E